MVSPLSDASAEHSPSDLYELPPELQAHNVSPDGAKDIQCAHLQLANRLEAEFAKRLPPSRQPPGCHTQAEAAEDSQEATPLLVQDSTALCVGLNPAIVKKFGKRTAQCAANGDIAIEGGKVYDMSLWRAMHNVVMGKFWCLVLIDGLGRKFVCLFVQRS